MWWKACDIYGDWSIPVADLASMLVVPADKEHTESASMQDLGGCNQVSLMGSGKLDDKIRIEGGDGERDGSVLKLVFDRSQ
jgi:hypothetical protein